MKIGILALQGAFIEHAQVLSRLGIPSVEIRQRKDWEQPLDAVILPGGESTVIGKLLRELDMLELLRHRIQSGFPVLGTCAGLVLLAGTIENPAKNQETLGTMAITVRRNAYGRQLGSFHAVSSFGPLEQIPMTFIRAPYITETAGDVEILSRVDGRIVAARQGNQLATSFHPELSGDTRVHEYFLREIVEKQS